MNVSEKNQNKLKALVSKMVIPFLAVIILFNIGSLSAQTEAYVIADSGLSIREKPSIDSKRIGKLDYGEAIEITERTNLNLVILDEDENVKGQWVKVKTPSKSGYVFDGYLTSEKVPQNLEFSLKGINLKVKNLNSNDEFKIYSLHDSDKVVVDVAIGDSPQGKTIIIDGSKYKSVSMFQRFENSITIMNEGPHCDLTDWEHYSSEWQPLERISPSKFKTLQYSEHYWKRFNDVDIEALKTEVTSKCGENWANYIKDIKTVTDYPSDIAMSTIFVKIILTDYENNFTEKIIEFKIPMGC